MTCTQKDVDMMMTKINGADIEVEKKEYKIKMKKEKIVGFLKENWFKLFIVIFAILFLYFTQIEPHLALKKKCQTVSTGFYRGAYEKCLIMGEDFFK